MQKGILESLARLTDDELAARVKFLAAREHATAACVIAHLAEMDTRDIHLRAGYPRLVDYCLKVLHLSDWEAWNRIDAGRVARRGGRNTCSRCEESRRVVPHHLNPWVLAGSPDDPAAYELRGQGHNDYEGRLYFGKRRRGHDEVRERPVPYGCRSFGTALVPEQTGRVAVREAPAVATRGAAAGQ
jgi:hypothetical protein